MKNKQVQGGEDQFSTCTFILFEAVTKIWKRSVCVIPELICVLGMQDVCCNLSSVGVCSRAECEGSFLRRAAAALSKQFFVCFLII